MSLLSVNERRRKRKKWRKVEEFYLLGSNAV
jgi:hypothetical protein